MIKINIDLNSLYHKSADVRWTLKCFLKSSVSTLVRLPSIQFLKNLIRIGKGGFDAVDFEGAAADVG